MGWFGKVVGGTLGGLLGGPVGAVIGAGLGAGYDEVTSTPAAAAPAQASSDPPPLACSCDYVDDDVGRSIRVECHAQLPREAHLLFSLSDGEGWMVKADANYADRDGDFFMVRPVVDAAARFYVPFGRLHLGSGGSRVLMVTAVYEAGPDNLQILGRTTFNMPFPGSRRWDKIEFIAPLVELCMHVVLADGEVLPDEIRHVKESMVTIFELTPAELPAMPGVMKRHPRAIPELLGSIHLRFPDMTGGTLLELLAEVAHCDGRVALEEVAVIRAVADEYGVDAASWQRIIDDHRLHVVNHHAVLGVSASASWGEIQAAYRHLVTQYHPDKVATLPREFQDLAHAKMNEINAAYAALREGAR